MDFQANQYGIEKIIQRIKSGRLGLPDFQRDFVWDSNKVVELLDSVARQWPIGSLLLLKGPQKFAIRSIDSGPEITSEELDFYILDGQQRITSLYHAISDVSDTCYYINFKALALGDDDYIGYERRDRFLKKYPDIETRAASQIALISEVWDLEKFYEWLSYLDKKVEKIEFVQARERKLGGLQSKAYNIMSIELDQDIALEALARIFETLNRTGLRLNAFDLMVATLYPSEFFLRDEWESAKQRFPLIEKIDPDAIEILKLVALLVRQRFGKKAARGVRQGDILKINVDHIRDIWSEAVALYNDSLVFCMRNFGVTCSELVPNLSMILGVAGWLSNNNSQLYTRKIGVWWIDRLFSQYFSQAANTRIVSDFENTFQHPSNNFELFFRGKPSDILQEKSKRSGYLLRGIGGLLIINGALDLVSGEKLMNEASVFMKTVTKDGVIRSLRNNDLIETTVFVSEKSNKIIGKEKKLTEIGIRIDAALTSQGINLSSYKRTSEFICDLYEKF